VGVLSIADIAACAEVDVITALNYAKFHWLRWRTKRRTYSAAQLAVLYLVTPGSSKAVAAKLGVLPVEAAMYRSAITVVLVQHGTTLAALLGWEPDALEHAWVESGQQIAASEPEALDLSDLAYIRRIVLRAERELELEG